MLKRSTKSIVRGGLIKTALQKKQESTGDEEIEKRNAEIDAARKRLLLVGGIPLAAVIVTAVIVLICIFAGGSARIALKEDEKLLVLPAENALLETIETGDVVQLYSAGGSIGSIRYVLVVSVGDDGLGLAMTDLQLQDYLTAAECGSVAVIPVIMDDPDAASAALEQQRAWNSPEISLLLSPSQYTMELGQTAALCLDIQAAPDGATVPAVTWSSTNEAVATVDATGTVTAVSSGNAEIVAACGDQTATCDVTVMVCATELRFDAESYEVALGGELQLVLQAAPEGVTEPITWGSSDPSVATVDASGKVIAHTGGTVTVTAKTRYAEANTTLHVKIPATSVVLNSTELQLTAGSTGQLAAVILPENTSDKTVTWSSSDAAIATVDANGAIYAAAAGTVTITASCGDVSSTCTVTVSPAPAAPTPQS